MGMEDPEGWMENMRRWGGRKRGMGDFFAGGGEEVKEGWGMS